MTVFEVGPFRLDAERLSLTCVGQSLPLGPKVVETLLAFVEHPGEVLSKEALLDRVWPEGFVEEANLTQNVYVLRKMFRAHGAGDPIETIPRYGYRLKIAVRVAQTPPFFHRRVAAVIAAAAFVAASLVLAGAYEHAGSKSAARMLSPGGARLYQIGRYYWNLRTSDGVRKSISFFERLIDTDPLDARGYAALADANLTIGDYCYGTHSPAVYFARAREYAKKALALDPNSPEAHAALGFLALHRRDATEGLAELRRAIALDPAYGPAHEWYGIALLRQGYSPLGLRHLKIAAELDPLSVATIAWLGSAAYADRRFGEAIAYSRQALELSPKRIDALRTIGESYEAQGETTRAIETFKRYASVDPYYRPGAAALLARVYARAHRVAEARAQLAYATSNSSEVDAADLLAAEAALGDRNVSLDLTRLRTHPSLLAIENAEHLSVSV